MIRTWWIINFDSKEPSFQEDKTIAEEFSCLENRAFFFAISENLFDENYQIIDFTKHCNIEHRIYYSGWNGQIIGSKWMMRKVIKWRKIGK